MRLEHIDADKFEKDLTKVLFALTTTMIFKDVNYQPISNIVIGTSIVYSLVKGVPFVIKYF